MLKELYHGDIALSNRRADPNNNALQEWRKLSAEFGIKESWCGNDTAPAYFLFGYILTI